MKCFEVINQPIEEGVYDPHIFKAIFMAGAPGAGKTTVRKKLLAHTGLKELDIDKWWEFFNNLKKDSTKDYDYYWRKNMAQRKNYIAGRLGMVIDGTAKDLRRIEKTKRVLEKIGYDTAMIFVNTDLDTAIQRMQARAKEIGRSVPLDRVKQNWKVTQDNLGQLQNEFGGNFFIVDNSNAGANVQIVAKRLEQFLSKKPTQPAATAWIQNELANRANS